MRSLVEFQILDINAEYYGTSLSKLMDNAGNAVAQYIINNYGKNLSVTIVCGKGNNGGDGFVCGRKLIGVGFKVKIIVVEKPSTIISEEKFRNINDTAEISLNVIKYLDNTDLLIDCLLGSGISGDPREPYNSVINEMNKFKDILSVDVPSGFLSNNCVKPDSTITFHDIKEGMSIENCGNIILRDVGFPKELEQKTGPGEMLLFPKIDGKKHKGQNGKIAIIGGGPFKGAPALAGLGAYRGGSDLVHVFVPENCYDSVSGFIPELLVHKCSGNIINQHILEVIDKLNIDFDSVVIGPGIGKELETVKTIQLLIGKFDNIVLDADGIGIYDFLDKNILLTPHSGELKRLELGRDSDDIVTFCNDNKLTILLKGETDFITDGISKKYNSTGHPRMAVGGTGDVLAGFCGSLLAKGLTPFEVARLASYTFGIAGERSFQEYGAGFLPTDLALVLSKILKS